MSGSVKYLRWQIQTNAWLVIVNYPLTIFTQIISKDEKMFYIFEIVILIMIKVNKSRFNVFFRCWRSLW
jgi:type IV secretory pathway VirB3-like protein